MTTLQFEPKFGINFNTEDVFNIIVVGAGGTGGHLVPNLTRMLSIKNKEREEAGIPKHSLTLIDKDSVEPKNLLRQNFVHQDIGKNKAEVLAMRYGRSFGENILYYPQYINSPKDILKISTDILNSRYGVATYFDESYYDSIERDENRFATIEYNHPGDYYHVNVIIDCTDNNKTRLIIDEATKYLRTVGPAIAIYAGNEEKSGQVVFNYTTYSEDSRERNTIDNYDAAGLFLNGRRRHSTPSLLDIYPNLEIDKLPDELSCAEMAVSAPQNIGANINSANIIFDYMNKLINNLPVYELAVYFDIQTMNRKTYYYSVNGLKALMTLIPGNPYISSFLNWSTIKDVETSEDMIKPSWPAELIRAEKAKEEHRILLERLARGEKLEDIEAEKEKEKEASIEVDVDLETIEETEPSTSSSLEAFFREQLSQ